MLRWCAAMLNGPHRLPAALRVPASASASWLGEADAVVAELFGKRQLKPVLVDFTTEDSEALQRYFVQAVDTATWGVLEEGYKEATALMLPA